MILKEINMNININEIYPNKGENKKDFIDDDFETPPNKDGNNNDKSA